MSEIIQYSSFYDRLISLSRMSSKFIRVTVYVSISSLLSANWYTIVHIYHILFIHSSINATLGCFHILAIQIMLLWTWVYKYLFKSLLSIILCVYPKERKWKWKRSHSMDCSLSGSSVHGIFQARVLVWIASSFSRGSPDPGIESGSPAL